MAPGAAVRYVFPVHESGWRAVVRKVVVRAAMLVETVVQAGVLLALRVRGRHLPMIVPFIGHGTTRRVRVGGRVVLGRPAAAAPAVGVPDAPATPATRRAVLRASVARFLTVEVPGAVVTISWPGGSSQVRADRDGYVDAVLDVDDLDPGWHEFEMSLRDGPAVSAQVLVVDPDVRIGLVSDVDDTILETGLSRGHRVHPRHAAHPRPRPGSAAGSGRALPGAGLPARTSPGARSSTCRPARGTCTRCCWSSSRCAGSRSGRCC